MMKLEKARARALTIAGALGNYPEFTRVCVAGSIRRMKPEVKDIEIVAKVQWCPAVDMLGYRRGVELPFERLNIGEILGAKETIKNGKRYKQFDLGDIKLDLFLVYPPAEWGVLYTIRTGPAGFSRMCVTSESMGGYLKSGYFVKGGALHKNAYRDESELVATPEEKDVFDYLRIDYLEPEDR